MPVDVGKTLKQALSQLTGERDRIERQIAAIQGLLSALDGGRLSTPRDSRSASRVPSGRRRAQRKRARMSAGARKAVSERMKAYWAKRRAAGKKRAAPGRKKGAAGEKAGA